MRSIQNSRGQALIGAMIAAVVTGFVGTALMSNNLMVLAQTRRAYVQSAMTDLDAKVRLMAMQPYAYACGGDVAGHTKLEGIQSCQVRPDYFAPILHVAMAGVPCDVGVPINTCGFKVTPPVLKDATVTTGTVTNNVKVLSYRLKYEGTDFDIHDIGYADTAVGLDAGLLIPTEILQSATFDCAAIDPLKPVFSGFDARGAVTCRGFGICKPGEAITNVTTQGTAFGVTCAPPKDTAVDCTGSPQQKISKMTFADGKVTALPCSDLPEAPYDGSITPPTCSPPQIMQNGVCVNPPLKCTLPQTLLGGVCVCPAGQVVAGPGCSCPAGQTLQGGTCVGSTVWVRQPGQGWAQLTDTQAYAVEIKDRAACPTPVVLNPSTIVPCTHPGWTCYRLASSSKAGTIWYSWVCQ